MAADALPGGPGDPAPEDLADGDHSVLATQLIEEVRQALPLLTSLRDLLSRQLAAAALARCNRLLGAMDSLDKARLGDTCGVLLRSIYETWLVGLYALYGGPEASRALAGAAVLGIGKLDRNRFGQRVVQPVDEWDGPTDRLRWDVLTSTVNDLLQEKGLSTGSLNEVYEVLYRARAW